MLPNVKLTPNRPGSNKSSTGIVNRSATFLDSYIYMKNSRYNAMYEKNKEILGIENVSVRNTSAEYLYSAFMEQYRILDSIITRVRNFAFTIRQDVMQNINQLLPHQSKINEFELAISKSKDIGKFKFLRYQISSIEYPHMNSFYGLFNQEIKQLIGKSANTVPKHDAVVHNKVSDLIESTMSEHNMYKDGLLAMEKIEIMTSSRLTHILQFFKRKTRIITSVNKDFRTFQFYLREYRNLYKICENMKPTQLSNGNVKVAGYEITFNDYFVTYKHFASIIKSLLDMVDYYDSKFFNKIYALQSNIESYNSIMNYVIDYSDAKSKGKNPPAKESLTEAYWDGYLNSDTIDAHSLINGNHQAQMLLWDNAEGGETMDEPAVKIFSSGDFDKYKITDEELKTHDINYLADEVSEDVIKDYNVSDEELDLAEKEFPLDEEITVPGGSTDAEVGTYVQQGILQ